MISIFGFRKVHLHSAYSKTACHCLWQIGLDYLVYSDWGSHNYHLQKFTEHLLGMPGTSPDTVKNSEQNSQILVALRGRGGRWNTECPSNPDWIPIVKAGSLFSDTATVLEHIVGTEGMVVEKMNE